MKNQRLHVCCTSKVPDVENAFSIEIYMVQGCIAHAVTDIVAWHGDAGVTQIAAAGELCLCG